MIVLVFKSFLGLLVSSIYLDLIIFVSFNIFKVVLYCIVGFIVFFVNLMVVCVVFLVVKIFVVIVFFWIWYIVVCDLLNIGFLIFSKKIVLMSFWKNLLWKLWYWVKEVDLFFLKKYWVVFCFVGSCLVMSRL